MKMYNDMDDLFREGLGGYAEVPPPAVWEALEKRLDKKDRDRPVFMYWYLLMALSFGLLSFSVVRSVVHNHFVIALTGNNATTIADANTASKASSALSTLHATGKSLRPNRVSSLTTERSDAQGNERGTHAGTTAPAAAHHRGTRGGVAYPPVPVQKEQHTGVYVAALPAPSSGKRHKYNPSSTATPATSKTNRLFHAAPHHHAIAANNPTPHPLKTGSKPPVPIAAATSPEKGEVRDGKVVKEPKPTRLSPDKKASLDARPQVGIDDDITNEPLPPAINGDQNNAIVSASTPETKLVTTQKHHVVVTQSAPTMVPQPVATATPETTMQEARSQAAPSSLSHHATAKPAVNTGSKTTNKGGDDLMKGAVAMAGNHAPSETNKKSSHQIPGSINATKPKPVGDDTQDPQPSKMATYAAIEANGTKPKADHHVVAQAPVVNRSHTKHTTQLAQAGKQIAPKVVRSKKTYPTKTATEVATSGTARKRHPKRVALGSVAAAKTRPTADGRMPSGSVRYKVGNTKLNEYGTCVTRTHKLNPAKAIAATLPTPGKKHRKQPTHNLSASKTPVAAQAHVMPGTASHSKRKVSHPGHHSPKTQPFAAQSYATTHQPKAARRRHASRLRHPSTYAVASRTTPKSTTHHKSRRSTSVASPFISLSAVNGAALSTSESMLQAAPAVHFSGDVFKMQLNTTLPSGNLEKAPITLNMPATDTNLQKKRRMQKLELGVKSGYESGFSASSANKWVIAPYIQYNISSRFSLMAQPALKESNAAASQLSGHSTYYRAYNDKYRILDSIATIVVSPTGTSLVPGWKRDYTVTQTHDSISKTYGAGGRYMEFEMPLLIKYKLFSNLSVYGGVNMLYSKYVPIAEHTYTSDPITRTAGASTIAAMSQPAPVPNILNAMNYAGQNITGYKPLYTNPGDLFRIGYMLGFSYELKKRWLFDVLMQQASVKSHVLGGYDVNKPLEAPYFRFMVGYRLR
jgi:hypothetical protein